MHSLHIEIANQHTQLKNPEARINGIIESIQKSKFKIREGTLSIVFVDEATICKIHEQFLGDPSPTDVITFPQDNSQNFAGEIFISVDQAKNNAKEFETTFNDELTLYLIHGCLHLFGLNDKTEAEKYDMRKAESELMRLINNTSSSPPFQLN
ncbi:MAG: rRNA maturation RNase YbeY [Coraliomargaritaceae bacterium]|tara:strand:- start:950 stop:1408 length:459 start_codon:yes stop_codon:yes gene_type:complete